MENPVEFVAVIKIDRKFHKIYIYKYSLLLFTIKLPEKALSLKVLVFIYLFLLVLKFILFRVCLCVCLCEQICRPECSAHGGQMREVICSWSHRTITHQCGCWELNSGPQEEKEEDALLAAEPPPQLPFVYSEIHPHSVHQTGLQLLESRNLT